MTARVHRRAFVLGASCAALCRPVHAAAFCDTPPPDAPPALKQLLGEYGEKADSLTVYEREGLLHADGKGMRESRLLDLAPYRYRNGAGAELQFDSASVLLNGQRLVRHDFGAEVEAAIQASVRADAERLRAAAMAAEPPTEAVPQRPFDLVALASLEPPPRLDIRYATRDNFMGIRIYELNAAFLQRPAAQALARVGNALRLRGYGLVIHDGYRPWFATKMFWEAVPPSSRIFVADPAEGSRHNRGCAVDLTLYRLADGRVVEMPGRYDELSKRSFVSYVGGTSRQRWHRDLLLREMECEAFSVYPEEWWHFDHADWPNYGIGTASFTELMTASQDQLPKRK